MKKRVIIESKNVDASMKLPQRLVEVYSLLASLSRQRRAAALNDSPVSPQPSN